jgi:hypothetical protein
VRFVVLAVMCAIGIAACGGAASLGGSATTSGNSLALEFANCMRAHGVPNFPDPGTPAGNVVDPGSPAVKTAGATCQKLEPNNPQPSRKPTEARIRAAFAVARCMRAHQVSGFPDPTLTQPPSGANVIDDAGVMFVLPPSFTLNSPAVQRASGACGLGPPARPSGS